MKRRMGEGHSNHKELFGCTNKPCTKKALWQETGLKNMSFEIEKREKKMRLRRPVEGEARVIGVRSEGINHTRKNPPTFILRTRIPKDFKQGMEIVGLGY